MKGTAGRGPGQTPRALVTGWFSFPGLGATAGDLLALEVTSGWLADAQMDFDVALDPSHGPGVDWRRVDPRAYTHHLFVCGPFFARRRLLRVLPRWGATALARVNPLVHRLGCRQIDDAIVELMVRRFDRSRQIGLNLSMLGPPGSWHPFQALVQRDGAGGDARADITLAHEGRRVPVVGVLTIDRQREYGQGGHDIASRAIEQLLARRDVAAVPIDTRLDRPNLGGLRTPAAVESLIARMDVVVTTRMHGAVLALKHGVPAVVIDPVPGGAKVTRQMSVLGWPHVVNAEAPDLGPALDRALDACLTAEARQQAEAAGARGVALVAAVRVALLAALAGPAGSMSRADP